MSDGGGGNTTTIKGGDLPCVSLSDTKQKKGKRENEKGKKKKKKKGSKRQRGEEKAEREKLSGEYVRPAKKSKKMSAENKRKEKDKVARENPRKRKKKATSTPAEPNKLPRKLSHEVEVCVDDHESSSAPEQKVSPEKETLDEIRESHYVAQSKACQEEVLRIIGKCKAAQGKDDVIDAERPMQLSEEVVNSFVQNMTQVDSTIMLSRKDTRLSLEKQINVEPVKRAWEDAYLCEPTGTMRPCKRFAGGSCVATDMFADVHGKDFTLREYYTPEEVLQMSRLSQPPGDQKMCLLCRRQEIMGAILTQRSRGEGMSAAVTVADMSNFVDVEGEYVIESCICSLPNKYEGIVDPVVMVARHFLEPFRSGGVRWLRQTIPYPAIQDGHSDF